MEHMKNIFLVGPSRSGKTSMGSQLAKHGYNHIIMDSIIETMNDCYPELNIQHGNLESPEFKKFLTSFCKNTFKYTKPNIIDLEVLSPEFAHELIDEEESCVIYLGYPNVTPEQKIAQMREYDTKFDWTQKLSDEQLKALLEPHIEESKKLQEDAKAYNYTYLDTSFDREKTISMFIDNLFSSENSLIKRSPESYKKYER